MGPVINPAEDRFLADKAAAIARGLRGVAWEEIEPVWRGAIEARATGDPADAEAFDQEIVAARERFPREVLPFTWRESQSGGIHDQFRPTYESLKYDYATEMESFRKPWLAIYGEEDPAFTRPK